VVVVSPRAITARRALEIVGLTRVLRTVTTLEEVMTAAGVAGSELHERAV
jgi:hypothetical protein